MAIPEETMSMHEKSRTTENETDNKEDDQRPCVVKDLRVTK